MPCFQVRDYGQEDQIQLERKEKLREANPENRTEGCRHGLSTTRYREEKAAQEAGVVDRLAHLSTGDRALHSQKSELDSGF